jgi:hypothetical protein
MSHPNPSTSDAYTAFAAELQEVLKHKYLESEKLKRDIGFEKALKDWAEQHRSKWRQSQQLGKK